jgi:glycosyltransferase involved in cell wall biosynthesis
VGPFFIGRSGYPLAAALAFCGIGLLDGKEWRALTSERLNKKKILLLTDWYEPGYKAGGPIQSSRNFVHAMHGQYEISVLTSDTDLGELKPYAEVPANQWIDRAPGIRIYYASRESLNSKKLEELISAENPDFIYLNSMYSYRFSVLPMKLLWRKKIHAPVVLSPRGMLRESAIKLKSAKKKLFIAFLNRLQIPENIRFHATDAQEKKDILRYFPKAKSVELIPNFSADLPEQIAPIEKKPGILRCVFISRIMPIKNILFFLKLLNIVPDEVQLEFTIYGEVEDEKYWQQAQKVIHFLPKNTTVLYCGPIPHEKVISSFEANHLFVLPSTGENFGHAIFEAFSAGRPVLISDKTPWRGLQDLQVGWDIPLDAPEAWLAALQEAANADQQVFNNWSEKCREYARERQGRSDLQEAYIKLFS